MVVLSQQMRSAMLVVSRYMTRLAGLNLGKVESDPTSLNIIYILTGGKFQEAMSRKDLWRTVVLLTYWEW